LRKANHKNPGTALNPEQYFNGKAIDKSWDNHKKRPKQLNTSQYKKWLNPHLSSNVWLFAYLLIRLDSSLIKQTQLKQKTVS